MAENALEREVKAKISTSKVFLTYLTGLTPNTPKMIKCMRYIVIKAA